MMAVPAVLSPRSAIEEDRSRLANLLHFETYVHRHLDWRRPVDWLGQKPYLVVETSERLLAALACPADPPGVAWIRLFASATRFNANEAWQILWPQALAQLRELSVEHAAAIPMQDWFREILAASQFSFTHNVVVLDWRPDAKSSPAEPGVGLNIRSMTEKDLDGVVAVDQQAFTPLWQNSKEAVSMAFQQASLASLIEDNQRIIAFQISTRGSRGLHLARLATHPEFQGRGLGLALVRHVQHQLVLRNESLLTVNTQDNNAPSLALYNKLGFSLTGEQFPVYQFELN
ncbi:MAG: GNAT family N-acetyltransferase [Anaerolineales bacterium]